MVFQFIRPAFRLGQRSIIQQVPRIARARAIYTTTCASNACSISRSSPSPEAKLNVFNEELTTMKSDLKADIKTLRSDMPSILDSVLESRKCKFQNRILFFVVSDLRDFLCTTF